MKISKRQLETIIFESLQDTISSSQNENIMRKCLSWLEEQGFQIKPSSHGSQAVNGNLVVSLIPHKYDKKFVEIAAWFGDQEMIKLGKYDNVVYVTFEELTKLVPRLFNYSKTKSRSIN